MATYKSEQAESEQLILENYSFHLRLERDETHQWLARSRQSFRPSTKSWAQVQYPKQAKGLISDMMQDMKDRGIIGLSAAVLLSPIILVNKPDGSKRMCLDYRHVSKHLAANIYPLPRLEELVELAAGHQ